MGFQILKANSLWMENVPDNRWKIYIMNYFNDSFVNVVRKVQCLDFRRISSLLGWLGGNWYFHSFSCGSAEKPGSKYEFEKERSKGGEILSSNAPPLNRVWMNGKLIPKPLSIAGEGEGYSPIWPQGSGIKKYGRNIEEIQNVWSNKCWKLKTQKERWTINCIFQW